MKNLVNDIYHRETKRLELSGKRIVLTADRSLMTNYRGNFLYGFIACGPYEVLPEWVFDKVFCPPVETDPITGEATQVAQSLLNLGLRHLNGSLEFLPTQRLHLMAGYSFRRQFEMALSDRRTSGGFTLGASVYFSKFQLHFANELRSVAGRMNTLSLNLNL